MTSLTPTIKKVTTPLLILALCCCMGGMLIGVLGAGFYNMSGAEKILGLTFQQTRPLHTGLVVCWIFLAGIAGAYYFLISTYKPTNGSFYRRARLSFILWILAGIGFIGGILSNHFTGREYIPFNPIVSLLILGGWICFAINFFKTVKFKTGDTPVYIWMWSVSALLFIWTFIEAHLYLLPSLGSTPLMDMSIQWKSYGTLVGSFNLLVYGCVYFVAEKLFNCPDKARSNLAFALFFVGVLNTFTNYGHHTYHLPQSPYIKWISFVVSMLEILIFAKACLDIVRSSNMLSSCGRSKTPALLFVFATIWTWAQLFVSILMSIPPINAFIHGTPVVTAHAMGTMIAIDSMMLWAVAYFVVSKTYPARAASLNRPSIQYWVVATNVFLFVFWGGIMLKGVSFGWERYTGQELFFTSVINQYYPAFFAIVGLGLTLATMSMIMPCFRVLLSRTAGVSRNGVTNMKTNSQTN